MSSGSDISPLGYLKSLESRGVHLDLGPVRRSLERLGHPERASRAILVAGTNGKGSIAAMLASILEAAGYRVGLYTSPHLIDFKERIRINGHRISQAALINLTREVRLGLEVEPRLELTWFEFITVLAFLHFARHETDIDVLEVGMGGRLDATNVVDPEVSVISNISLEHREYLGDTLDKITAEKAGIVRDKGTCVTGSRNRAVVSTLEKICRGRRARLVRLGHDIRVRSEGTGKFSYFGLSRRYRHLCAPLRGKHQLDNAAVALGAIELLETRGFPVEDRAVRKGLAATRWEGRIEQVLENPTVIVDGAHNPAGIAALAGALREEFAYRRLVLVFGALGDKDYGSMLRKMAPLTDRVILTGIRTDRARSPEILAKEAGRYFRQVSITYRAEDALNEALGEAGSRDLVCITGSLYLVGEIKQIAKSKKFVF